MLQWIAFSAFLAITQVISGTTNTNSLQAVDKPGSKAMQIIDCQFGTLIIPIIIQILFPTRKKACVLHAKTVIWEWNGSFCFRRKKKKGKGTSCLVLKSKINEVLFTNLLEEED